MGIHSSAERPNWRALSDARDDWSCPFGRAYRYGHGEMKDKWFWSMTAFGQPYDRTRCACEGFAESRDAAFKAVRTAWEGTRAGRDGDELALARNRDDTSPV